MYRLTIVMCWLILCMGLSLAPAQPAGASQKGLQGSWNATKAERDGKAADDVVGHRLSFTGQRFEIREPRQKPTIVGNDSTHLRLLQHDLRNPYMIRI